MKRVLKASVLDVTVATTGKTRFSEVVMSRITDVYSPHCDGPISNRCLKQNHFGYCGKHKVYYNPRRHCFHCKAGRTREDNRTYGVIQRPRGFGSNDVERAKTTNKKGNKNKPFAKVFNLLAGKKTEADAESTAKSNAKSNAEKKKKRRASMAPLRR